jgi:hypothetical protein
MGGQCTCTYNEYKYSALLGICIVVEIIGEAGRRRKKLPICSTGGMCLFPFSFSLSPRYYVLVG